MALGRQQLRAEGCQGYKSSAERVARSRGDLMRVTIQRGLCASLQPGAGTPSGSGTASSVKWTRVVWGLLVVPGKGDAPGPGMRWEPAAPHGVHERGR